MKKLKIRIGTKKKTKFDRPMLLKTRTNLKAGGDWFKDKDWDWLWKWPEPEK